jgi:hypothetical protein
MKNILVVGVGNFGSWWVISLIKFKFPLKIYCFDNEPTKYSILKKRLNNDYSCSSKIHEIFYLNSLDEAPKKFDTIIISTNADNRLEVIQELNVKFTTIKWIVEKVVAQSPKQVELLCDCLSDQKVYINHSRRLQPASNFFKTILRRKSLPNSVKYIGGCWELASNSFHFVDLISYWFDTELLKVETNSLNNNWHASSTRRSYFDIRGILISHFVNGIKFEMDWSNKNNEALWIFEYVDGEVSYNEITGAIFENGKLLATIPLINFSELGPLLEPFFLNNDNNKKNNLPSLADIKNNTVLLIEAYLLHWNTSALDQSKIVPIS